MKKIILIILFCVFYSINAKNEKSNNQVIIDSKMTFEEAMQGTKAPKDVQDSMIMIDVEYFSFDNKLHRGQLVINKALKEDYIYLFDLIKKTKFLVKSVIPIVKYGWSDDSSMNDNNTSAFNFRYVSNTKRPSNHSWGRAIDINPKTNPAVHKDGRVEPKGAKYNTKARGSIHSNSIILKEMIKREWEWGGNWVNLKDYQHLQKLK